MGDGRWEMGDGRWEMGDGKSKIGVGRGAIEELEINRLRASRHASLNRLKTGLQTNEKTVAAASISPSTLQLLNPSTTAEPPLSA